MKRLKETFEQNSNAAVSKSETKPLSRRDFFKKTGAISAVAAASVITPTRSDANSMASAGDDPAIMHHPKWGQSWGDPVTKNRYGIPSKYEHNVTRRNTKLLASGNYRASIAVTPIHESDGIITPNGLFFSRCHGGIAHIDPNEFRLMITGLVEKTDRIDTKSIEKISKSYKNSLYRVPCKWWTRVEKTSI